MLTGKGGHLDFIIDMNRGGGRQGLSRKGEGGEKISTSIFLFYFNVPRPLNEQSTKVRDRQGTIVMSQ